MIASSTPVYVWLINSLTSQRNWISGVELRTNGLGQKVLVPALDDDPHFAAKFKYDYAVILRRRLNTEGLVSACRFFFSLNPTGDEVGAEDGAGSSITSDGRVPMSYRGLMARPGFDARAQQKTWYVRFPGSALESIKGATPEEVINMAFERGPEALRLAEKAAPEAPPEEPKVAAIPGSRFRPGDLRR